MKFKKINIVFLTLIVVFSVGTSRAMAHQMQKPINGGERDYRNNIREVRDEKKDLRASTTAQLKDLKEQRKEMGKNMREDFKERRAELQASTTLTKREIKDIRTDMFKRMDGDRKDMAKNMKLREFGIRKDALTKQLGMTIENLVNIRARINERIVKLEGEGKTMTDAKSALANADSKISKAKLAVEALNNYKYTAPNTTASTTAEIGLDKPRQVGDAAIKAVKDARDSLKLVIRWITPAGENTSEATSTTSIK